MKVSIITVSYNSAKTIEQTILSVLNQTYTDIEYIIIDGQSVDGTCEIIEKYKDEIAYYTSEPDNGLYDAMNKGIEKATGDIVGIINSDDWYENDAVEKIVNCFKSSAAELVYGKIWVIYQDGTRICSKKVHLSQIWYSMSLPHPSVFVKRNIYDKYGKFDTRYDILSDYDLMLRFYIEGVRFVYIDEIIANFRYGGISTNNAGKCVYETWRVSLSHINKCPYDKREKILCKINNRYAIGIFNDSIVSNSINLCRILELFFHDFKDGIVIWGTGVWGSRCFKLSQTCGITTKMFVDNNIDKWGQYINGVNICSPEVLRDCKANVLVAVSNSGKEIEKQLSEYDNINLRWVTLEELALVSLILDKS